MPRTVFSNITSILDVVEVWQYKDRDRNWVTETDRKTASLEAVKSSGLIRSRFETVKVLTDLGVTTTTIIKKTRWKKERVSPHA